MKPWEMNWQAEEYKPETSEKKPWEQKWEAVKINAQDYDGSIFMGEDGEDVKPFEKFNKFFSGLIELSPSEKTSSDLLKDFGENITTFEVNEKEIETKSLMKAVGKAAEQGVSSVDWGEVGKALGRGSLEFIKSTTSGNLRIVGDWYKDESDTSNMTPLEKHNVGYNNFISKAYTRTADLIDKVIDLGLESDFLKPDEKIFSGEFEENPSLTRAISTIGSGLPSIVGGAGVYKITKSAILTTALLSEIDAQDIYFGAREKGVGKLGSTALLTIGTAGTYAGEKVGLDAIFGKKTRPFAKRVVDSMLSEGLTESAQTWWQNAVKKYGYDDTQKLMQGVLESGIGGALTGGVATTFLGGVYEARDSMKENGATDAELDALQENMATEIAKHRDLIEPMFEANIQKSLDSLEEVINSNIDAAEVEKAKKISSDLKNIEDKYYDMFKGKMPEEQAKSTSELLRNMAFFGSKMTGLTPAEFEQQEFPKMDWVKTFKEIQTKAVKMGNRYINKDKLSLARFLQFNGGLVDKGGELKAFDARKTFPMLINNKNGMSLDDATLMAWERGYFPEFSERPEINDLLNALDDEIRGIRKRYQPEYQKIVDERLAEEKAIESEGQLDKYLAENLGLSDEQVKNMSAEEKQNRYNEAQEKQEELSLSEDEQERYATMRENGATHREAMDNIKGEVFDEEDLIPFQWEDVAAENALLDEENPAYDGETITINGQEKTVYNSNGERIAQSEAALRNFYRWFGDSKVVDKQGRPLVVYHGTNKEFEVFSKGLLGKTTQAESAKKGFFFTDDTEVADSYADYAAIYQPINELLEKQRQAEKEGNWDLFDKLTIEIEEKDREISQTPANQRGKKVYAVYLKANNVMEYDAKDEYFSDIGEDINKVLDKARKDKKDGVIIKNLKDQPNVYDEKSANHFVVFESNQIKSTSNRGTYSESENIYYQSAFAGSRVDYDRPSLEAIGSGEGNQAHGWGLYYALNRDVAERYRENFTRGARNLEYDGKEIKYMRLSEKKKAPALKRVIHDFVYNSFDDISDMIPEKLQKMKDYYEREVRNSSVINDKERGRLAAENLESLKDFDISKLKEKKQGQVHEVDIPENPYLLDEDAAYFAQPEIVRNALDEVINNLTDEQISKEFEGTVYPENRDALRRMWKTGDYDFRNEGKDIYNSLSKMLGSPKAASQMLEKYGIKGITYEGRQDGRCFVIFNPEDVKVIQKFYQGEQSPQGAYINRTVYLFEKADVSTIPHEMAHFWREELKSFDNAQAKALLEAADRWETAEFERLYKVIERDNGYAVANKDGSIVYDRQGKGFTTEGEAMDYAKNELFARGFERYLAEGKAPNKSMKQVFHNFLMWLHKKLRDAVSLKLNLSPDIKQVYAEILGGQDIDAFLNTDPDTFIQNRVKLAKDREEYLDGEIEKAIAAKSEKVKDKSGKGFSEIWANAMIPLSTRAKRVSPKLRTRLRRYEFDLANSLNKKYAKITPFMDKWKNMSEEDVIAFDLALKNDYIKKQLDIVDKYGAREEWEQVRKLLEETFDEAINAGLDLGYRPDYFPRKVKDTQGFLDYIRGSEHWSRFEEALKDADPENTFTAEQQADFINKYLRGFVKVDLMPNKYGSEKTRSIETIDYELNKFYAPSIEALVSYVEGLNSRIQASKFLGKDSENLEESIGGYLGYLLDNNIIAPNQIDEVRAILQARFGAKGVSNKWLRTGRDMSYIYTMGGINSAITQIDDLSVSMFKAGVWNTLTTAFESKNITKKDLGLESIAAEFIDGSKTSKMVNQVFKATGLDAIDGFAKETLVNAEIKKFQKMYKEDKGQLQALLEPILEDETAQTMEDIKNGVVSDNVLYVLFSELSDVQPISLSELPAFYNRGGNLRVLYMLKSFAIKRIDIFRNECYDKIRSKDVNVRKEGVQNLFKLAATMIVLGASKDKLIDLLYGRDVDLTETVINNLLGLVGISKFQIYQAREKGLTSTVKDIIFPPLYGVVDDVIGDIWNVAKGKREIKDMETLKGIPLVGRFYYWWFGRGAEKSKGKKKKY